ncbi:hypothetical protein RCH23_003073 [Cryobacterium sp. CAN_C3]|uniref:hypothetical protein n=2 Tax=Cryobacterium TaxID=69578 RepID=UPI0018CB51C4|nr:hypothetical protein [Cryobacterium sp. CAN_C3]MEC5155672.1 hypothetical protein [Cryobacterium sp. CAN_C3]
MNPEPVMPDPVPVDLAAQLADIESQPLDQRAKAFGQLQERLRAQLEDADVNVEADTDQAGQA